MMGGWFFPSVFVNDSTKIILDSLYLAPTREEYMRNLNMTKQHLKDLYESSLNNISTSEHTYLDPNESKKGKEIVDSIALHPNFISELAKNAEVSVQKGYEPFNWLKKDSCTRVSTFITAAERHLKNSKLGYNNNKEHTLNGDIIDIEVNHLVCAAYNLLMAAQIIKDLPEHDDRLFKEGKLK